MELASLSTGQLLAPIVSALAVIVLYHYIGRAYLGADENSYWNTFCIWLFSSGDSIVRQKTNFALTREISTGTHAGTTDAQRGDH